jgi:spore maturation protein CgeB
MSVPNDKAAICPVCKRTDHSTFLMRKDGYDLYQCAECQHIFVWPVPTVEVLQHVYSFAAGFQVQPSTVYDENTTAHEKNRESLRQLERFCRRGRLLDVGCSSGRFLWLAKQNGWPSVCGVELSKDTAQIAKDNGLNVFVGELPAANYPPSSFDAINVGDVIEHVRDPTDLLSQLSALLQPNGAIVLVTPNHDALFPFLTLWLHRLFNMPWSHATPPLHLNQFSEKSLTKLLQSSDLKVVHKRYRGCDLHYELGETHVLRSVRQALRERRMATAAGRLLFAIFTAAGYTVVYGIDRCCFWKRKDFEMLFVVRKASSNGQPSNAA